MRVETTQFHFNERSILQGVYELKKLEFFSIEHSK